MKNWKKDYPPPPLGRSFLFLYFCLFSLFSKKPIQRKKRQKQKPKPKKTKQKNNNALDDTKQQKKIAKEKFEFYSTFFSHLIIIIFHFPCKIYKYSQNSAL
jgi:hypothetical protein